MLELGALHGDVMRVCEIGPGSGRYLDKVVQVCHPTSYEIYETAGEWRKWLVTTYKVTANATDGVSLASTPTGSVDLVHCHKVLQGLPIFDVCNYFKEMMRVLTDSGTIVFDLLTEGCMSKPYLQRWMAQPNSWIMSMVSKQFVIEYFTGEDFGLVGNFFITMKPGITEYFVFRLRTNA